MTTTQPQPIVLTLEGAADLVDPADRVLVETEPVDAFDKARLAAECYCLQHRRPGLDFRFLGILKLSATDCVFSVLIGPDAMQIRIDY